MQLLGEKRALSKDSNFAINEDTDSWEIVTKETIINCFRKAGITPAVQQSAIADSEDPFKDLQESLNDLQKADSSMVPDDVTATALVSLNDVIATAPEISESDIIEELRDRTRNKVKRKRTMMRFQLKKYLILWWKSRQDQRLISLR